MIIKDFDDVFEHIGGFGPYQYLIFGILCVCNCFYGFVYFGQIFMVLTPPHHCKVPNIWKEAIENRFNVTFTENEMLNLTIPLSEDATSFDKCRRFDFNITEINEWESFDQTYQWPAIECDNGWEYDFTSYYPTITSQLNWVCSEDWKPPTAQMCFFFGSMLGVPLFGSLADHFGRLPVIILTNVIGGVFGIASSFSRSFTEFCVLRFIVGTVFDSNLMIIYILALEFVSAKYRSFVANVPIVIFLTLSICLLPWIAYYVHDWTMFGVIIYAPMLLVVFIIFIGPESVRWLAGKGKTERAIATVKTAAKGNGKKLNDEFMKEFQAYLERPSTVESVKVTCFDLLKTPTLRKRLILLCIMWVSISLAYDGHMRHTENIGFNFFVTFTIMGATELPADVLTILLMEWIGRKHTTVWTLVFSGLSALATVLIEKTSILTLLIVAVTGRFLITMSANVGLQYIVEVLPTVGRAQGSAAIHTLGLGMLLVSPYIVYLSKIRHWLPYAVFGLISIFGGLTSLLLPETMGEKLPDTLVDGEEFCKGQIILSNPFKRANNLKASKTSAVGTYLRRPSIFR